MKKIIFVAMVIATPFLGAAEWNFNDPSKLASGEVVVPGVSKFTASNNNLTTSNVVIGGGGGLNWVRYCRSRCLPTSSSP